MGKRVFIILYATLVFLLSALWLGQALAMHLTCDPQPASEVTKYKITINGEVFPAEIENVGTEQVRIYYNVDHLGNGKYTATAQAGNDKDEWSKPSNACEFYRGVPTPQNIGLYCVDENPQRIPQDGFKIYHFSSQEIVTHDRAAKYVIDGNPGTLWVSDHSFTHPHEIQIDLGEIYTISGLYALPRSDEWTGGIIKDYEVYVSENGTDWAKAASGVFVNDGKEQFAGFNAVPARYVSLVALSEIDGNTTASVAEFNVLGY